jgi:hypothetical protein
MRTSHAAWLVGPVAVGLTKPERQALVAALKHHIAYMQLAHRRRTGWYLDAVRALNKLEAGEALKPETRKATRKGGRSRAASR